MMPFTIGLDTVLVKKVVLNMLFFLIIQESKLIQVVLLSLEKALTLRNFIIVIKSVFNKVQNHYNIFLEKCTYK